MVSQWQLSLFPVCCVPCRYMKPGDVTRARSHFYHGNVPVLLFSERFHYFNRYRVRGEK